MKKLSFYVLLLSFILSVACLVSVSALNDDVDIEISDPTVEDETTLNVSLESGKDDGYFIYSNNTYTAVPYDGNEFLGWFKVGSDTAESTEITATYRQIAK